MRGILFDLDGTLLDIDLEAFLRRYFAALEKAAEPLAATMPRPSEFMPALGAAVHRMTESHPGQTNRDVFFEDFRDRTGIDLDEHWGVFEDFYVHVFPTLRDTVKARRGARDAVRVAFDLGLKVAVATNPIFPRIAIDHRLAWAGLDGVEFDAVTTYEEMRACKPHPEYFRQTASLLGLDPSECLMVGDDRLLDMAAADVGMATFYVGPDSGAVGDYLGDLLDVANLLPRLMTSS